MPTARYGEPMLVVTMNDIPGWEIQRVCGDNAIVVIPFDTTELGDVWTELCAYGTAVQAVSVTDAAKCTAQQPGYGGF